MVLNVLFKLLFINSFTVTLNNVQYFQFEVKVLEKRLADYLKYMPPKKVVDLSSVVIAPMPGVVKSVAVKPGQPVSEHQIYAAYYLRRYLIE